MCRKRQNYFSAEFCINQTIDKLEKIKSRIKIDVSKTCLSKVKPIQEQKTHFLSPMKIYNLRLIKKTLKAQRKMFDGTVYDDTNYSMFELVLDQSVMNFINANVLFKIVNIKQSVGCKTSQSKAEIVLQLGMIRYGSFLCTKY